MAFGCANGYIFIFSDLSVLLILIDFRLILFLLRLMESKSCSDKYFEKRMQPDFHPSHPSSWYCTTFLHPRGKRWPVVQSNFCFLEARFKWDMRRRWVWLDSLSPRFSSLRRSISMAELEEWKWRWKRPESKFASRWERKVIQLSLLLILSPGGRRNRAVPFFSACTGRGSTGFGLTYFGGWCTYEEHNYFWKRSIWRGAVCMGHKNSISNVAHCGIYEGRRKGRDWYLIWIQPLERH